MAQHTVHVPIGLTPLSCTPLFTAWLVLCTTLSNASARHRCALPFLLRSGTGALHGHPIAFSQDCSGLTCFVVLLSCCTLTCILLGILDRTSVMVYTHPRAQR